MPARQTDKPAPQTDKPAPQTDKPCPPAERLTARIRRSARSGSWPRVTAPRRSARKSRELGS